MKSFKTLVCVTSFALCFGAASMASAASFSPIGAAISANGSITVKSPSSFQQPVTCNILFQGVVNSDGTANINSATVSGSNSLCALPKMTNLPWKLSATSTTTGTVTNVGYTIAGAPPIIPATNCGPTTITVGLASVAGTPAPGTTTISATNQTLAGSCTVVSLSVAAPGAVVIP
ncbi:protein activator of alkane oxidation PraB [Pseudomonas sp. B6002]|uniref:alkane oxidation protein activator PraB n=1 Tax=Pseudomonas sp. B6002 TaxID=2726978 RepID=UPI0015A0AC94|nr:alkane oxidation protein activator PraB [Pseudomonas sp. B6002]NVZ50506.1 protein activator of alkane oxidation PraB [Pseudomonas sp. B6002]